MPETLEANQRKDENRLSRAMMSNSAMASKIDVKQIIESGCPILLAFFARGWGF